MTQVHNHGPDEGRGLDCNEHRTADGRLVGACMTPGRETTDRVIRLTEMQPVPPPPIRVEIVSGEPSPAVGWVDVIGGTAIIYNRAAYPEPVATGYLAVHADGTVRFVAGNRWEPK
jgi:hypothetical protein